MPEKAVIKKLVSFDELEKLIGIQRSVWRHDDLNIIPVHQFAVSIKMGGILLGISVTGDLAGFVFSFPAVHRGKRCQHSHMLAVLPEYQGRGLGKALKTAQRQEALRQGYGLITWTYDPLQARNANLNLQTLGAFSRTYLPNLYGLTPALCLAPGVATDRLLIEWPIKSKRVAAKFEPGWEKTVRNPENRAKVLESKRAEGTGDNDAGLPEPGPVRLNFKDSEVLVETPKDIWAMTGRPELVSAWQAAVRRAMTGYFRRGFRVEDFLFGDRAFYVLRRRTRR